MKRFVQGRNSIIQYIGLHGGMPVLGRDSGEPGILRPEEDETAWRRVGWPEFFKRCEERGYVFVYDDAPESFEWAFVPRARALKEVGPHSHGLKHFLEQLKQLPVVKHG